MSSLPLGALRAFATVYACDGVRPAARELHITHSAVSRHVRELELWVGVPLVERKAGSRRLAFTREGQQLGRAAASCMEDLSTAIDGVRESRRAHSVTVATTPSVASRWLLPRMPALRERHRAIELSVVTDQRPRAPLEEGADVALRMGTRPLRGTPAVPLMDDTLFPVVCSELWTSLDCADDLDTLARRAGLLHDRDPHASWSRWRKAHGPATLDVREGARLTSSDLVLGAAEQGLGVALARGRLAADALASGRLVRPLGSAQIELPDAYWLVVAPGAEEREAVSLLVTWLAAQTAGAPKPARRPRSVPGR